MSLTFPYSENVLSDKLRSEIKFSDFILLLFSKQSQPVKGSPKPGLSPNDSGLNEVAIFSPTILQSP